MRAAGLVVTAAGIGMFAAAAQAADVTSPPGPGQPASLAISLGHLNGVAHELVYDEDGSKLSELKWDLQNALVLNGGMTFQATERLALYGNVSVGLAADSMMDDYDWSVAPPAPPDSHSWHDDTALDHYVAVDAGVAIAALASGRNSLSVLAGFKYTDAQWTASGGCYDYEGDTGCFQDGEKGITYRLTLPAIYGGLAYAGSFDRWTVALDGRAGLSVNPHDRDHHWMRDLVFQDDFGSAPYVAVNGKLAYALNDSASMFGSVAFDKFFTMKGSTTMQDLTSGETDYFGGDAAGANFYSLNMALGMAVSF